MRKKILTNLKKAVFDYQLIQENDKICIGVSGGKDSMALAYSLAQFKKYAPFKFDIICINLKLGFPDMDFSEVKAFFIKNEIEFYQQDTSVSEILYNNLTKDGKVQCSICSKLKKALIIDAAKKYNCNKVSFAHHGDDAIETLFLNSIYGGRLATFNPKMYLDRTDTTFIRPFVYVRENDIINYIKSEKIPLVKSTCPNDGFTKRQDIKDMLATLYQQFPQAYKNYLSMLHNQEQLDLWTKEDKPDYLTTKSK